MIRERIFENYVIFDIDSKGDNYESFKIGMKYLKEKEITNSRFRGGFDSEHFYFEYFSVQSELTYTGFFGTELRVSERFSGGEISKIRHLAEEIYEVINNISL